MGSIAGDLQAPVWDISYRYRFFIWIDSRTPFKISRLAVELCNEHGGDLLVELEDHTDKTAMQAEYDRKQANQLVDLIAEGKIDRFSLKEADETFQADEDSFWGRIAMSVRRYRRLWQASAHSFGKRDQEKGPASNSPSITRSEPSGRGEPVMPLRVSIIVSAASTVTRSTTTSPALGTPDSSGTRGRAT